MIRVDLNEIDRLIDIFNSVYSLTEDVMERAKGLRSEMDSDPEFCILPSYVSISEIIDTCINRLYQVTDTINITRNALVITPEKFIDSEAQLLNKIQELTLKLDTIGVQLDSCIASSFPISVEHSDRTQSISSLEKNVLNESYSLEVANISIVRKRITDSGEISSIKEM